MNEAKIVSHLLADIGHSPNLKKCRNYNLLPTAQRQYFPHILRRKRLYARFAQSVPVKETYKGETVWEGVVHVFDLAGHPKATRAYAWSSPIERSSKRRFFAVLHMGAIKSPADAVRAAIVAEHRTAR